MVCDLADDGGLVAMLGQDVNRLPSLGGVHRQHHPDAHVEDVEHLPVRDLPVLLKEVENRKNLPCALVYLDSLAFLKDSRNILIKAAGQAPAASLMPAASREGCCN